MQRFLSIFTLEPQEQRRRWTFHLRGRKFLRYVFHINEMSTTLSHDLSKLVMFRLRPHESTAATSQRPLRFVFEQIGKVGLWSKRLLTFTIYSPTKISAQLSVSGILFEEFQEEPFEVVLRGKPRMFMLAFCVFLLSMSLQLTLRSPSAPRRSFRPRFSQARESD